MYLFFSSRSRHTIWPRDWSSDVCSSDLQPLPHALHEAVDHGGHGGMDYVLVYRLMQCMRQGLVPDIDVYDSAAWCAAVPLSEASLDSGGPVEIPDFTRGQWEQSRPGLDSERAPLLECTVAREMLRSDSTIARA